MSFRVFLERTKSLKLHSAFFANSLKENKGNECKGESFWAEKKKLMKAVENSVEFYHDEITNNKNELLNVSTIV